MESGESRFFTVSQAAKILGVTRQYIYTLCHRGDIPFLLVGGPSLAEVKADAALQKGRAKAEGRKPPLGTKGNGTMRIERTALEDYITTHTY